MIDSYIVDCGLYIVGSSMSGFGTKTSDMDLCLMLSPHQVGINRGSDIIARVVLNLLNEFGKRD